MPANPIRALLPLYVVVFVGFLGYSLMITVFTPMILGGENGMLEAASTAERTIVLGALLMLYPLGQFLGSPVIGGLSDRFGRRPVLLSTLTAATVMYMAIALALELQSLALLMAASFVAGLLEANVAIAQGAISDAAPREERSRLFGYVFLAISLAYVVGPLGGGKLADPSLVSWFDFSTPYWAVAGLLALVTVWVASRFRETSSERRVAGGALESFANLARVVTDRRLRPLYLVNFVLYLAIFGFFRAYPMYLVDEFAMNVSEVSEYIAYVSVPILFANAWLVGALSRRYDPRALAATGALATGLFMALIVVPSSEISLWFTLAPTGLALAICLPFSAAMLSLAADDAEQGRAMGNNQSMQVGAEALSGLAGGGLAAFAFKLPLLVFAGASFVAGLLYSLIGRRGARGPGAALALAVALCLALLAPADSALARSGPPQQGSLLFTVGGERGTLVEARKAKRSDRYTLTLRGLDRSATWFADRPRRDAGLLGTSRLFGSWGRLGFRADPPNAALVVNRGKARRTMAIELKLRAHQRRSRTARFDVRWLGSLGGGLGQLGRGLEPRLPRRFRNPLLFIDNGGFDYGCVVGQPRLMAIDRASWNPSVDKMIPADGRLLKIARNTAMFSIYGTTFGGNGSTTFAVPKMEAPPGTSWYVCTGEGVYPNSTDLVPECRLGEIDYWILPFPVSGSEWLPADGREVSSLEFPEYGAAYAGSARVFNLPRVTAPAGMTPLVCMKSAGSPETEIGQVDLYPGPPAGQSSRWLPAAGQAITERAYPGLYVLLQEDKSSQGKVPDLAAPFAGTSYYVAASGTWPLG